MAGGTKDIVENDCEKWSLRGPELNFQNLSKAEPDTVFPIFFYISMKEVRSFKCMKSFSKNHFLSLRMTYFSDDISLWKNSYIFLFVTAPHRRSREG